MEISEYKRIENKENLKAVRFIRNLILLVIVGCYCENGYGQINQNSNRSNNDFGEAEYNYALIEATKQYILNNYLQAVNLYSECLKYKPQSAAVNFQLSQIYLKAGDMNNARQYALRAYNNDKSNKWYLINIVNIYQNIQEIDSAIVLMELLVEREDAVLEYKYLIASLYERNRQYDKAIAFLDDIEKQIGVTKEISIARYRMLRMLDDEARAFDELKKIQQFFADDYTVYGMLAEYFRDKSMADSARYYYGKIINNYEEYPEITFSYSEFLLDLQQVDSARIMLMKTITNKDISRQVKASYFYQVLQDNELFNKMMPITDTLSIIYLKEYPDDINVQSVYADIQFRMEHFEETAEILKRIIENDEGNYVAWEQLLYVENRLNRVDSTIKYSKKAITLFRNRPMSYLYLGAGYFELKDYNVAVEYLEQGRNYTVNKPVMVQFYNLLAEAYNELEIYDSVWNNFERALEIEPENIIINNN